MSLADLDAAAASLDRARRFEQIRALDPWAVVGELDFPDYGADDRNAKTRGTGKGKEYWKAYRRRWYHEHKKNARAKQATGV